MLCMKTTHKYKATMKQYHKTVFFTCEQDGESQASDSQSGDDQSNQSQSNQDQSNQDQSNQGQSNQDHSNQGQSNQGQSNNNQHFANQPSGGSEFTESDFEGLCCTFLNVLSFFKFWSHHDTNVFKIISDFKAS